MIMAKEHPECFSCSYKLHRDALITALGGKFTYGQKVTNKKFHHEEIMTFCCIRPSSPDYAIVLRGDRRLSDVKLENLVAVEED